MTRFPKGQHDDDVDSTSQATICGGGSTGDGIHRTRTGQEHEKNLCANEKCTSGEEGKRKKLGYNMEIIQSGPERFCSRFCAGNTAYNEGEPGRCGALRGRATNPQMPNSGLGRTNAPARFGFRRRGQSVAPIYSNPTRPTRYNRGAERYTARITAHPGACADRPRREGEPPRTARDGLICVV